MYKKIYHILCAKSYWDYLKIRYAITYKKVVLVLTGDNKKLDFYCLKHLDKFLNRKCAKSAIIFFNDLEILEKIRKKKFNYPIKMYQIDAKKMHFIYDFYSYMKFFDNIVFTYINTPKDNLLGKILLETDINEEEAACLALYHLRNIPK